MSSDGRPQSVGKLCQPENPIYALFGGRDAVLRRISDNLKHAIQQMPTLQLQAIEYAGASTGTFREFGDGSGTIRYNAVRNLFGCFGLNLGTLLGNPDFIDQNSREYWTKELSSLMAQGPKGIPVETASRIRAISRLTLEDPVLE